MSRYLYTLLCILLGISLPVFVKAQLNADFTSNIRSGCAPILVEYSDQSTGNPTKWSWDLGNGTFSTLQNPSAAYLTPGTYTVKLTVTNASGANTKTVTNHITVASAPIVNFKANDSGAFCPDKVIQFQNLSTPGTTGGMSCLWDFGDGNTSTQMNPSHKYISAGNYNVTLSVTNDANCSNILTKTSYIQIVPQSTPNFSSTNNSSCSLPLDVNFTSTSIGAASYLWDFGNGNTSTVANPSNRYTVAGSYTVRLITTSAAGCSDTVTKTSFVNIGNLDASFTTSASTGCTNNKISFSNTSVPGSGNSTWYFGDGTSATGKDTTHAYNNPGTYTVKLVVKFNNCSDSTTQTITINQGPNIQFSATPTTGCAVPLSTQFTNATTGASSYLWLFGDGNTSTAVNPSHSYSAFGNYTVRLAATGTNGCNDTLTKPSYIKPCRDSMIVTANPASGCIQKSITFNAVMISGLAATSYTWNFGDGTIVSGGATMTHTYTSPGNYNVSVNFTSNQGCAFSSRVTVMRIGIKPTASFTSDVNNICPEKTVTFINNTTGPTPLTYNWNFGYNTAANTQINPTHIYNITGTYTVRLIATNNGCSDTAIMPAMITVKDPTAKFGASFNCINRYQVSFIDSSTNANSWSWDFGDGRTSTAQYPVHIYQNFGNYTVTLTVTNAANGCSATKKLTINIADLDARFTVNNPIACGQSITLNDISIGAIKRKWEFGDGDTSTLSRAVHAYKISGNYAVKLIVSDTNSCKDSLVQNIQVTGIKLDIDASDTLATCPPLTVRFTNNSTGASSYTWSFDNGNTSSAVNPTALFTTPDVYLVKIKGRNAFGCTDSITQKITVLGPTGTLSYSPLNGCSPVTVQFSAVNSANTQQFTWDMNNGLIQTTTIPSFSYTYTQAGKYLPKLLLRSGSCIIPFSGTDTIKVDKVEGIFSFTPDSICQTGNIQFNDTVLFAVNPVTTRDWSFGDGGTSTVHHPSHTYAAPGIYSVRLIIGTSQGCKDTITKQVTILQSPNVSAGNDTAICQRQLAPVQLQASGAVSYVWTPAGGLSCTGCSNPVASLTATTAYTVVGTAANGCKDTNKITITVNANPNVIVSPDTTICDKTSAQLHAAGATNYNWSPITNLSCNNCSNPVASPTIATTYTLIGSSAAGCTDTAEVTINVNPLPTVNAGIDQSICKLDSAFLKATGAINYSWAPAANLSCNNCADPTSFPLSTTTYTVTGTDNNGCSNTDDIVVSLHPDAQINAGAAQDVCAGRSTQLQATGGLSYVWTPDTYLSCTNCDNPQLTPSTNISYTVYGTDINGCNDSDIVAITVIHKIAVDLGDADSICIGDAAQLMVSGGSDYLWTPSEGLSNAAINNPIASPDTTTFYTVIIKQGSCFSDTGLVGVFVSPLPTVNAGIDQTILAGTSVNLFANATHTTRYLWEPSESLDCFDCPNPVAMPKGTTKYTVYVSNEFGCKAQDDVILSVKCDNSIFFMANTFTPNADGNNDRFYPQGKGIASVERFRIYSRWGEIVYDAQHIPPNNELYGWDGLYKNEQMKPDVFVYILDATCDTGEPMQIKGDVSLMR